MTTKNPEKGYVALLGWSLNAIDAIDSFDRRYVVVAPPWAEEYCTQNEIPFMPWDFDRLNERSHELAHRLKDEGVDVAIPLFEETVEWAGRDQLGPARTIRACWGSRCCSATSR